MRLYTLLLALAVGGALGRPLEEGPVFNIDNTITIRTGEERNLLEGTDLALALDAAPSYAGNELPALQGSEGDATWPSQDPAVTLKLSNAGYTEAYGGAVLFNAPAPDAADLGTYGESTELLAVSDGFWGSQFTALVWYKPNGEAMPGDQSVLMQLVYADDFGSYRPSATWRVGGFEDFTHGTQPITGYSAAPSYPLDLKDCWAQLAIVKSGPSLTFYANKAVAGTASAGYVVNDYGAVMALGVDFAQLAVGSGNDTVIDPATVVGKQLGWLNGSVGVLGVYSRALSADEISAAYDDNSGRFSEALCQEAQAPVTGVSPSPAPTPSTSPSSPAPPGTPSPAPGSSPGTSPGTSPLPSPSPPGGGGTRPPTNSTLDVSTANKEGSGTSGKVTNQLAITGGEELSNFASDPVKQNDLRRAIVNALNLPPSAGDYPVDNVQINVIKVEQRTSTRAATSGTSTEWVVVVEYVLLPTPTCPVEVLYQYEIQIYLFIRIQQPVMPWWQGPDATVCTCNQDGECGENTPPVPPPVQQQGCSANICFLLDGSKSLFNVDAWNDVVASARSIMYSISDPAAIFNVFWFSNDVERIGYQVTGAEVAANNDFTDIMLNTVPNAHGTWMAQAIETCENVLFEESQGPSKTIVLITDGKPTDRPDALSAADQARKSGIKMVVVGAGDIDYDTLVQLGSGPQYTYVSYDLDSSQLLRMADLASSGICREPDRR